MYSLPTVRALGHGHYVTSLRKERHDEFAPLLAVQTCLYSVSHNPNRQRPYPGVTHDFDRMRRHEFAPMHVRLLTETHALPWKAKIDPGPWLDAPLDWTPRKYDRAIVARSFRYRGKVNWKDEVRYLRTRHRDVAFVGLPSEFEDFHAIVDDIPWIPTENALDLARVIYESRQFSGNQSFPLSLAVGYGVPHRIEIAPGHSNCSFPTHAPIP